MTQFEGEFVSLELCGAVALYPEHCQNCSQGGMLAAFFEWPAIQQHSLGVGVQVSSILSAAAGLQFNAGLQFSSIL